MQNNLILEVTEKSFEIGIYLCQIKSYADIKFSYFISLTDQNAPWFLSGWVQFGVKYAILCVMSLELNEACRTQISLLDKDESFLFWYRSHSTIHLVEL